MKKKRGKGWKKGKQYSCRRMYGGWRVVFRCNHRSSFNPRPLATYLFGTHTDAHTQLTYIWWTRQKVRRNCSRLKMQKKAQENGAPTMYIYDMNITLQDHFFFREKTFLINIILLLWSNHHSWHMWGEKNMYKDKQVSTILVCAQPWTKSTKTGQILLCACVCFFGERKILKKWENNNVKIYIYNVNNNI